LVEEVPGWGIFHSARSELGGNRQGVTSRQALYLQNFS
jgi:hypothetical protein